MSKKPNYKPGDNMNIKTKLYYEGKGKNSMITQQGWANNELTTMLERIQDDNVLPEHPSPLMDTLLKLVYYSTNARRDVVMLAVDNNGISPEQKQKLQIYDEIRHTANDLIALAEKYKAF